MEQSKNKLPIYPEIPTQLQNDKYRYDKIIALQKEMENEKQKYKRGNKICTGINLGSSFIGTVCSTSAVASVLAVVTVPVTIPLTVLGGISYSTSLIATIISKKLSSKTAKHLSIYQLARNKSIMITDQISKIIQDDKINPDEFSLIVKMVNDYYTQKAELKKNKVDMKKVMEKAIQEAEIKVNERLNN